MTIFAIKMRIERLMDIWLVQQILSTSYALKLRALV